MKKRFKKIYLEITNSCNLKCSFCNKTKRNIKTMSVPEFLAVIAKIKPYTDYVYLHLKGEPLMHHNLGEILKICNDNQIKVNITTNGTLIKEKENVLLKYNIRQINFSLHSENNIEISEYLNNIFEFAKKASKENIIITYRLWTLKNNQIDSKTKTILDILKNYYQLPEESLNENNFKINDNLYLTKENEFIWPDLNNAYYNEQGTCYGTKDHIGILSDGTVVPCCLDAQGIISLGNIFESTIEDIINSEKFNKINDNLKRHLKCEELCRHCNFLDR